MDLFFGSIIAVLTSMLTYGFTRIRNTGSAASLHSAVRTVLECLGASTVFLAVNFTIGTFLILVIRTISPYFVSIYILNDLMLVVLSLFQGFVFQLWWRSH